MLRQCLLAAIYGLGQLRLSYPWIGAVCIVTSVIGHSLYALGLQSIMGACTKAYCNGCSFSDCDLLCYAAYVRWLRNDDALLHLSPCWSGCNRCIGLDHEYYTSTEFRPVRVVAKASKLATAQT